MPKCEEFCLFSITKENNKVVLFYFLTCGKKTNTNITYK